jgi:hypothetical protein
MNKVGTLADLVARKVALKEQQERIADELSQIDERLRAEGIGNHDAGDWTLQVIPNRRLDPAAIEQTFPVTKFPQYYKPVPNLDALKANIAPVELAKFYREGTPIVKVK